MKKILIAEDDPFLADIYQKTLKGKGYQVDVANDGKMALEKIINLPPDLLMLDINLPKISGWELLAALRKDPKTQKLNVMVISNISPSDYPPEALSYDVKKFFLKVETSPTEILQAVEEIVGIP